MNVLYCCIHYSSNDGNNSTAAVLEAHRRAWYAAQQLHCVRVLTQPYQQQALPILTRRPPTQCQSSFVLTHEWSSVYRIWFSSILAQPFATSVFPVQPTEPIVNSVALFLLIASFQRPNTSPPQTTDFLCSISTFLSNYSRTKP